MALFGNDYDAGYRSNWRGNDWRDDSWRNDSWRSQGRRGGYDTGYTGRTFESDRNYFGYGSEQGSGYDRSYKSRWQRDYGDPFGDRSARTPMRMIRPESGGYDRGFMGGYDRNFRSGYGQDYYSANPMGYDPYTRGTWNRYDRFYEGSGRGYDAGWF